MRVFCALLLATCISSTALAQTPAESDAGQPTSAARGTGFEADAHEVRQQFEQVLRKYPPDVGRILKMDPTMLSNQQYLAQYPAVQQFLAAHPEIARNPSFYLGFVQVAYDYTRPTDPRSIALEMWSDTIESVAVFATLVFVSMMIAWLVKTVLRHRQWLRMSRVQTEAHNKLLERFAGTSELLAYAQSPAGRRFLEAAPIPVEDNPERSIAAPFSRILWSVQAGIVLVIGGLGFQFVSGRVIDEVAQGMWTIGVLASAFGLGFIIAGAFSYVMSRRLGLLDPPALRRPERDSTI